MTALKASVVLTSVGLFFTLLCLIKSTPLTITGFFMLGLPCFGMAIAIYLAAIARLVMRGLASHRRAAHR